MNTYLWRNIFAVESKLTKNIGLLYQAKSLLEEKSVSTYRTKPKTIHFHQKHAVHIVFNEDNLTQSRPQL